MSDRNSKRVLVVYFTQTGQLKSLIDSVTGPLQAAPEIDLSFIELRPKKPYPFPWPFLPFLDTMPCCVLEKGRELEDISDDAAAGEYDLVILAYQAWFLSPVPPMTTFLRSPVASRLLAGTPVITLIGCRGMWLMAQQAVKRMLEAVSAVLVGNIAVCDQGNAVASLVTTPRWMFTGRKDGFWGIFPPAGIAQKDIEAASRFGERIREALEDGRVAGKQLVFEGPEAAPVDPRFIASERVGRRLFGFWARVFDRAGPEGCFKRKLLICLFLTVFFPLLVVFVPLRMVLFALLGPLLRKRLAKQAEYFY